MNTRSLYISCLSELATYLFSFDFRRKARLTAVLVGIFFLCSNSAKAQVPVVDSITIIGTTCGVNNGQVIIHASGPGPFTYSIDNCVTTQTSNHFTDLARGDYLIKVVNANGRNDARSIQLPNNTDPDPPIIDCPPLLTIECNNNNNDNITLVENWINEAIAFDARSVRIDAALEGQVGDLDLSGCSNMLQVSIFAEDECNTRVSCSGDIQIIDSELPNIICPPDLTVAIENSSWVDETEEWLEEAIAADNCTRDVQLDNNFDFQEILMNCEEEFSMVIDFFALDDCSNSSDCTSNLFVINELEPVVFCDAPMNFECGTDPEELFDVLLFRFEELFAFDEDITVEDDLNYQDVIGLECGDQVTLTFSVIDACERMSQCFSDITIIDDVIPTVESCPGDLTIIDPTFARSEIEDWLALFSATDVCSAPILTNDFDTLIYESLCTQTSPITVNFGAADNCGNSNSSCTGVLSLPSQATFITCPTPLALECGVDDNTADLAMWIESATAMINATDVSDQILTDYTSNRVPISCDTLIDVRFSITDLCGNPVQCMSTIRVTDTTAPSLICPDDIEIFINNPDKDDIVAEWILSAKAEDNCFASNIPISFSNLGCNPDEPTPVAFVATDNCGIMSDTCISILTLTTQDIIISCPDDLILECNAEDLTQSITTWLELATATINGDEVSDMISNDFMDIPSSFSCSDTIDVIFSISDQFNNTEQCTKSIMFFDTTPPNITCPDSLLISVNSENNMELIQEWLETATAEDNCNSVLFDFPDIDIDNLDCGAVETVELSAIDDCGNSTPCFTTLTVTDDTSIGLSCPDNLTFACNEDVINEIQNELDLIVQESTLPQLTHDLDAAVVLTDCISDQTINITFSGLDNCNLPLSCTTLVTVSTVKTVYIPNAISKRADNPDNRFFTAYGNGDFFTLRSMIIYDRWGGVIFESSDTLINEEATGWDVIDVLPGVYVYLIDIIDPDGNIEIFNGTITVF